MTENRYLPIYTESKNQYLIGVALQGADCTRDHLSGTKDRESQLCVGNLNTEYILIPASNPHCPCCVERSPERELSFQQGNKGDDSLLKERWFQGKDIKHFFRLKMPCGNSLLRSSLLLAAISPSKY